VVEVTTAMVVWLRSGQTSIQRRSAPATGRLAMGGPECVARPKASGSVNRWLRPESVRHMSVTTATQRLTAAHWETRRDKSKMARETGKTQLTGNLRR
jgi:hypothetical protein